MFEKYNINELYLGSVSVWYADNGGWETNAEDILMTNEIGCGYLTILRKLSDYYTQDGKQKDTFSRRQAVKEAKNHYDAIHAKRYAMIKTQNGSNHN